MTHFKATPKEEATTSALSAAFGTAATVLCIEALHIPDAYIALSLAASLSLLPTPSFQNFLFRLLSVTLAVTGGGLLLVALPESPWVYFFFISFIAAIGYHFFLKNFGAGTAFAFSAYFVAMCVKAMIAIASCNILITGLHLLSQAIIPIVLTYGIACLLKKKSDLCTYVSLQSPLARIFHTDSAAACENLMDTASASNCSSGSMKHTAVVAIHHLPCHHQDSRRLATNQYEICGLNSMINIGLVVSIAIIVVLCLKTSQSTRLIIASISGITTLEIEQSATLFKQKMWGYIFGALLSIAYIVGLVALTNDFAIYLLSLGLFFGCLEWLANYYGTKKILLRAMATMFSYSVLMIPAPDSNLYISLERIVMSLIGFSIAILVFLIMGEIQKITRFMIAFKKPNR